MGIIYKITLGDYWYIGKTKHSLAHRRFYHKRVCFNRRNKAYHRKLYKYIKSLGYTKETFKNINMKIVYNCDDNKLLEIEDMLICLDNPFCLNMIGAKLRSFDRKKYYKKNKQYEDNRVKNWNINNPEKRKTIAKKGAKKYFKKNKEAKTYYCKKCDYNGGVKSNLIRHYKSKRHINNK